MSRLLIVVAAVALFAASCGGSSGAQVASLSGTGSEAPADVTNDTSPVDQEAAVLAFAACMRDHGVTDFEDPDVGADGSLEFRFRGQADTSTVDRDTMQAAFEACRGEMEGLAFGPGSIDRSEIEDRLVEFASCMRENGYDMPDPDFGALGPGQGGGEGGGGPFGGIDPDDPSFQSAMAACQDVFGGGFRFGGPGPGGGPPPEGGASSGDVQG